MIELKLMTNQHYKVLYIYIYSICGINYLSHFYLKYKYIITFYLFLCVNAENYAKLCFIRKKLKDPNMPGVLLLVLIGK